MYSVAVFVRDIERAIAFYRDDLGLPLAKQGTFGAEFLEQEPHLGVHPAVHPDALAMVGRHTGVTFHVPDLLEFCDRLRDRGVALVAEPARQSFGLMAMVADPEGNVFALWQDAPPPA